MNINNEYILNIVYSGQYEYSLVGKPMAKGKLALKPVLVTQYGFLHSLCVCLSIGTLFSNNREQELQKMYN